MVSAASHNNRSWFAGGSGCANRMGTSALAGMLSATNSTGILRTGDSRFHPSWRVRRISTAEVRSSFFMAAKAGYRLHLSLVNDRAYYSEERHQTATLAKAQRVPATIPKPAQRIFAARQTLAGDLKNRRAWSSVNDCSARDKPLTQGYARSHRREEVECQESASLPRLLREGSGEYPRSSNRAARP